MSVTSGCCVKLKDGRIGRVREFKSGLWKIRVKRFTSNTHQFVYLKRSDIKIVKCPDGWMSVNGYNNYVRKTLKKMINRNSKKV
jgi:hypothetical protein